MRRAQSRSAGGSRLEADELVAEISRLLLQRGEHDMAQAATPGFPGDVHAPHLCRRLVEAADPAAGNRFAVLVADDEDAVGRLESETSAPPPDPGRPW